MKKIGLFVLIVSVAVFSVFSLSGCAEKMAENLVEKVVEKAAEQEGENIDVDIDSGNITIQGEDDGEELDINISEEGMTVESEDGESEINMGGTELPEEWPSEVAVNPDISIIFTATDTSDGKKNFSISGTYDGSGKSLFDWYVSSFDGWTEDYNTVMESNEGSSYSAQYSNDSYSVSIMIGEAEGEVTLVQNLSEK